VGMSLIDGPFASSLFMMRTSLILLWVRYSEKELRGWALWDLLLQKLGNYDWNFSILGLMGGGRAYRS
jgi:hypothetical protein